MSQILLKRLVNSHHSAALAWSEEDAILLNDRMLELAGILKIDNPGNFAEWQSIIGGLPDGISFLTGNLPSWSGKIKEKESEQLRWRLDGSYEAGVFLILGTDLKEASSKSFDLEETYQLLAEHSRTIPGRLMRKDTIRM